MAVWVVFTFGAATLTWHAATTPQSQLFGPLTTHGPRDQRLVALTFDDGPNRETTLAAAALLDTFGVKGTFFTVGRALDQAPDITRALIADGHLVGSHAETHNTLGWLSPSYREVAAANRTLARDLGACPRFFRPPHGYHTPFMTRAVTNAGMRLVQWDVSAHDWDTTDADLVARRVLAAVQPGSIVLLHDGLDGDLISDRTVLLRALPKILEGLRALDLHPVRLDQLLDQDGYRPHCP